MLGVKNTLSTVTFDSTIEVMRYAYSALYAWSISGKMRLLSLMETSSTYLYF